MFDCHVHTTASGHAFGTIEEIAGYCRRYQTEGFAITDHGPAMPGSASPLYFQAIKMVPRDLDGIKLLRGAEVNILDYEATLDLPDYLLRRLDLVIASLHDNMIASKSIEEHTRVWVAAAQNPLIDVLGHTGRGPYRYDIPTVLNACRETGTLIELNNWTLKGDPSNQACREIAIACQKMRVPVVISSDAHLAHDVGNVSLVEKMLSDIGFPEELIMNQTSERLINHLKHKKPWLNFEE